MTRITIHREFKREGGGFDHREIECRIMDSRYGPLAYSIDPVAIFDGFSKCVLMLRANEEIPLTECELSDAQKILDRIKKMRR